MDRKNPFNIPTERFQFIIKTFSGLILKLKSPSGTSFCLYFAYEEYRTDDSSCPADWYHTSEVLHSYRTVHWRVCRNSTVRRFLAVTGALISTLRGTSNFCRSTVQRHSTGLRTEQLSADCESSVPVISADQQSMCTIQGWGLSNFLLDLESVPLDCLSHRYGTPHKRSTGQMKYRCETLTSKLVIKTWKY